MIPKVPWHFHGIIPADPQKPRSCSTELIPTSPKNQPNPPSADGGAKLLNGLGLRADPGSRPWHSYTKFGWGIIHRLGPNLLPASHGNR
jgi:hypothetical protein